jgi:peptidoglycan hydrolase-like protein with peptidoglycan-binding domain
MKIMDISSFLAYVPTLIKYGSVVKDILDMAKSNSDVLAKLSEQAKPIIGFLEQYGAALFPNAAKDIQAVGGAIAAYDPNVVKWVQGAYNEIMKPLSPLTVDGIYGPLTRAAVSKLQEKFGLKVDGLAGRITQSAIDAYFAKQVTAK